MKQQSSDFFKYYIEAEPWKLSIRIWTCLLSEPDKWFIIHILNCTPFVINNFESWYFRDNLNIVSFKTLLRQIMSDGSYCRFFCFREKCENMEKVSDVSRPLPHNFFFIFHLNNEKLATHRIFHLFSSGGALPHEKTI